MPKYRCPHCQRTLKAAKELPQGAQVKCPGCGNAFAAGAALASFDPPPPAASTDESSTASGAGSVAALGQPTPAAEKAVLPAGWLGAALKDRTCQACGAEAETIRVEIVQQVSVVVLTFWNSFKGNACRRCIQQRFWAMSTVTLLAGWWAIPWIVVTPFVLLNNLVHYIRSRGLRVPPEGAAAAALTPAAVQSLERAADEIVSRVGRGESFAQVASAVSARTGATPGQIAIFVARLVAENRLVALGDLYASGPRPATPSERVLRPAVGLMFVGAFNLLCALLLALVLPIMAFQDPGVEGGNGPAVPAAAAQAAPAAPQPAKKPPLALLAAWGLASAIAGALVVYGAVQMCRLRSYRWARAAAILSAIPGVAACCAAGIPVGIWSLVVLSSAEVRSAFPEYGVSRDPRAVSGR